jgi:hypothetical protein
MRDRFAVGIERGALEFISVKGSQIWNVWVAVVSIMDITDPYSLFLIPYSLFLIPYSLSLIPYPLS